MSGSVNASSPSSLALQPSQHPTTRFGGPLETLVNSQVNMSSRALRKLHREQEEQQQQLANIQNDKGEEESDEDTNESAEPESSPTKNLNAFDMLNLTGEDEEDIHEDSPTARSTDTEDLTTTNIDKQKDLNGSLADATRPAAGRSRKKNKKKKKQADGRESQGRSGTPAKDAKQSNLDEIDAALLALKSKAGNPGDLSNQKPKELSPSSKRLYELLATDSKNLNALNEMKRLFGNAILEGENEEAGTPGFGRRRGRGPQPGDLGGALAGRNSPVSKGQGLAGLALRRNVFMLGKEDWPKATSGGLGMEVVEKAWDFTTEYRFVHNSAYQDVQRQFDVCVESLNPQRMIQLLQFNREYGRHDIYLPSLTDRIAYHISTLLQVSEIAKQQGDHSVSGDLLERALFSFGRSVHSSFHTALAQGEARLDFRRPENREFWLASWRYIGNLGQRGTWRTAYEWAKLLLSLDPEGDPYCIGLLLDQIALRGGQSEHYVELANTKDWYSESWSQFPNVQISKALAEYKLKRPAECRASLTTAVKDYPWIFARLFQELNIDSIPKSIWGKAPRSKRETFDSEVYVTRAKDLWNTPEAISFLVEVVESVDSAPGGAVNSIDLSLNEARHIILSDIPTLIAFLPRTSFSGNTIASDPLPPPDSLPSYTTSISPDQAEDSSSSSTPELAAAGAQNPQAANESQELSGLRALFSRVVPWTTFGNLATRLASSSNDQLPEHISESSLQVDDGPGVGFITIEELEARVRELQQLRQRQQGQHGLEEQQEHEEELARARRVGADREREDSEIRSVVARRLRQDLGRGVDISNPTDHTPDVAEVEAFAAQLMLEHDPTDALSREYAADELREFAAPSSISEARLNRILELLLRDPSIEEPAPNSGSSSDQQTPAPANDDEPYDDERNQRWLAGQGLLRLKDFTTDHGIDEKVWLNNPSVGASPVDEYVERVGLLEKRATRNFILDYVLQQGTSSNVRDLIKRLMESEDGH